MIAIIGLVLGIVLGVVVQPDVPALLQPYLPIAVVAALDTLAGGLQRASTAPSTRMSSSPRSCSTC